MAQTSKKKEIQNTIKLLRLNEAGILDQARLRPHITVQRPFDGKIINVLLKLKSLGKSEKTLAFVSARLKYLAKNVDLNLGMVNLYTANKMCAELYKDSLVKDKRCVRV